jgi:hypothetical protein
VVQTGRYARCPTEDPEDTTVVLRRLGTAPIVRLEAALGRSGKSEPEELTVIETQSSVTFLICPEFKLV